MPINFRNNVVAEREFVSPYDRLAALVPSRPLYKYLSGRNATKMTEEGSVFIGTLAYYRKIEATLRADKAEGQDSVHEVVHGPLGPEGSRTPGQQAVQAMFNAAGDVINIENTLYYQDITCPDAFIYCTSWEYAKTASDNAEACVEITDVPRFFELLTVALGERVRKVGLCRVGRVTYRKRGSSSTMDYDQVNPAFLKDPDPFAIEKEIRGAWGSPLADQFGDGVVLACRVSASACGGYRPRSAILRRVRPRWRSCRRLFGCRRRSAPITRIKRSRTP